MTTNPQTDLPARLEAALTERFTELGNPFSAMRRQEKGPDGWPASRPVGPHHVAEVLRELLPAVSVPAPAPTDRAAEVAKHVTRAIFALKAPSPDGSKHYQSGWDDGLEAAMDAARDAVLAVLPAPNDRAVILREAADAIDATRAPFPIAVQNGITWATAELRRAAAASGSGRVADETQAEARAALIAELLPAWEAVYEPGNVSDYLIGYANDQDVATGAAEAWLRSQAEVTGRLEWVSEEQLATGRYDRWFELIERHGDGIDTGPGVIVRRRVEPAVVSQPDGEA
ncbi:hypothetical protein ABT119_06225 [Streptomyces sp. NPDC001910]|uniref:hypothetical protein n=1 Tax=Streptomyces sp. NPDC001910 TaxID=3154403 RepID=UPI00332EDC94